jgi:hypothetical protein
VTGAIFLHHHAYRLRCFHILPLYKNIPFSGMADNGFSGPVVTDIVFT